MSANRIRLARPLIATRAQAEATLGEIALLTIERNEQKLAMDRGITAIREAYETPISTLGKAIEEKTALLETWASANPDEFPPGRKSVEMVQGVIGYRTGMPKLKTLLRWTWAKVLDAIKAAGITEFVRVKEEVDKEAILSAFAQERVTSADLKHFGVEVAQDEAFFVEPRLEALENRVTKEAA